MNRPGQLVLSKFIRLKYQSLKNSARELGALK